MFSNFFGDGQPKDFCPTCLTNGQVQPLERVKKEQDTPEPADSSKVYHCTECGGRFENREALTRLDLLLICMGCIDAEKLIGVTTYVVTERKRLIEEMDRQEEEFLRRAERGEVSDEERREYFRKKLFGS